MAKRPTIEQVLKEEILGSRENFRYYAPSEFKSSKYAQSTIRTVANRAHTSVDKVIKVISEMELSYSDILTLSINGKLHIEIFYWNNRDAMMPSAWMEMFFQQLRLRVNKVVEVNSDLNKIVTDILKGAVALGDVYNLLEFLAIQMYSVRYSSSMGARRTNKAYYGEEGEADETYPEIHSFIVHWLFEELTSDRVGELTACALFLESPEIKFNAAQQADVMTDKLIAFDWTTQIWNRVIHPVIYQAAKHRYPSERMQISNNAMKKFDAVMKYNVKNYPLTSMQFLTNKRLVSFIKVFTLSKLT